MIKFFLLHLLQREIVPKLCSDFFFFKTEFQVVIIKKIDKKLATSNTVSDFYIKYPPSNRIWVIQYENKDHY